jgi:hypothetical protein
MFYCNEYRQDDWFVQPLKEDGKPICTIAKNKYNKN